MIRLWQNALSTLVLVLAATAVALAQIAAVQPPATAAPATSPAVRPAAFAPIDAIVNEAIAHHELPGAVVVVGHNGHIVFHRAYGMRSLEPTREAMTEDTIFDMASLTKDLVTATAVMQLYEQGKIRIDDPVAHYIAEFGANGKQDITIRQCLTHYSGLAPDLDLTGPWHGREEGLRRLYESAPIAPPGVVFRYSDENFIALGALVERVSGLPLEVYAQRNIVAPLGLADSGYLPPTALSPAALPPTDKRNRIAPTQYVTADGTLSSTGTMLRGMVHDPTARRMDGVAGHAGFFSTAADVSIFAQALLDRLAGRPSIFPLNQLTLAKMTEPEQPATGTALRGFGWDIDSAFSSNRGTLFPVGSFGHTGFTGTSLWMDPQSDSYVIILTNAVHPAGGGHTVVLRSHIADAVAQAIGIRTQQDGQLTQLTGYNESLTGARHWQARNGDVMTGIDVLESEKFLTLQALAKKHGGHLRMGLLTSAVGLDRDGRRTIDVLARDAHATDPGLTLTTLFSPEHGLQGNQDTENISNTADKATGLPIISLYGSKEEQRRPSQASLRQLDAVVIDLQDVGVRYWTYDAAMGYFLEAAPKAGIDIIVLDRPNPVTGSFVQGPVSDIGRDSYTNYMPVPVRHGMTIGELARYYNGERHLNAALTVVKMKGWERGDWFDSTGLAWTNPSPNLRSQRAAELYIGIGLIETSNISVGRGTDTPFELLGAPWIDARTFALTLNARLLPGVRFVPVDFTPAAPYPYAGQLCHGVSLMVMDRNALDGPELGLEIASALWKLYPNDYKIDQIDRLLVNKSVLDALRSGEDPQRVAGDWRLGLEAFMQRRAAYLEY
ncbi:MAG: exo-beta-N-acetylmuramidase NamZ domain-containing protein [Acidobacteriaceae bacterium]